MNTQENKNKLGSKENQFNDGLDETDNRDINDENLQKDRDKNNKDIWEENQEQDEGILEKSTS